MCSIALAASTCGRVFSSPASLNHSLNFFPLYSGSRSPGQNATTLIPIKTHAAKTMRILFRGTRGEWQNCGENENLFCLRLVSYLIKNPKSKFKNPLLPLGVFLVKLLFFGGGRFDQQEGEVLFDPRPGQGLFENSGLKRVQ